ncbi:MAG: cysteine synthase family protein [Anaerolineales bacterium]|nr:cysteine synthase family protein [Anaerolineales bacterium]MCB9127614.1 cysteine synthase family protein [Ardenticatenales bacterium]
MSHHLPEPAPYPTAVPVGQTPLVRLRRLLPTWEGALFAKLEWYNPSGSDQDRLVVHLLSHAVEQGELQAGGTIVEPTSGNIAFALAAYAIPAGFRLILVMPRSVPASRVQLLRAMGAEIELTAVSEGMRGAQQQAETLATSLGAFRPRQFDNPAAPAGYEPLADELWRDCAGALDGVVVPVSTGSELTGIGRRLRVLSGGRAKLYAVEPAASPVLSGGAAGHHRLFGIGPSFVPANYDSALVDEVIPVSQAQAQEALLRLYRREALLSGPPGGAALAAAMQLIQRPDQASARLALILPDQMERYNGFHFWRTDPLLTPVLVE